LKQRKPKKTLPLPEITNERETEERNKDKTRNGGDGEQSG
jgi:hypothetical protein